MLFLENEEESTVLQHGSYERYLAQHYAFASHFYSVEHYSLPNYLAATSGDATNYFSPLSVTNVGSLASAAGLSWMAYLQSEPKACDTSTSGLYYVLHDPFALYRNVLSPKAYCDEHLQSFTAWSDAVKNGTLPNYGLVIPNNVNDGHNTGLSAADSFLRGWLPPILNSSLLKNTVIFILYDEGPTSDTTGRDGVKGGGHVYLVAVGPDVKKDYSSTTSYNTYDLLTTTEWLLGLGHTGNHDSWTSYPPMKDLFPS